MAWYAYAVAPQKEFIAREILHRNGFETLLPIQIKHRRRSRHAKARVGFEAPMMPGYLFIQIPDRVPWWMPFHFRVVHSIVGIAGQPTVIRDEAIEGLKALSGSIHETGSKAPRIRPGDDVQITDGPLAGHLAKVETVRGKKATAIFKMLGADRAVTLDVDLLDAA